MENRRNMRTVDGSVARPQMPMRQMQQPANAGHPAVKLALLRMAGIGIAVALAIGIPWLGVLSLIDLVQGHPGAAWHGFLAWCGAWAWVVYVPTGIMLVSLFIRDWAWPAFHAVDKWRLDRKAQTQGIDLMGELIASSKKGFNIDYADQKTGQMWRSTNPITLIPASKIANYYGIQQESQQPALALPAPVQSFGDLLQTGRVQAAIREGRMLLGYADGQLRYGSWQDLYSCGIGGVPGSGKTTTVRFMLFQGVLAGAKLLMIDPHIREPHESLAAQFQVFRGVHVMPPCDDTPVQVTRRIRFLTQEYNRRIKRGLKGPAWVFVIDEFNATIRHLPDEVRADLAELLLNIAQEGRKFGLFAMLIGQRWSEQDLGGKPYGASIRSSLASVLAHRFTDEDQAKKLIGGKNGARCLELEQGHYFFRDTNGKLTEMITPNTVEADGVTIQNIIDGTSESTPESTEDFPEMAEDFSESTPSEGDSENTPEPPVMGSFRIVPPSETTEIETLARRVLRLQAENVGKADIMRRVWNVNPGATDEYKQAVQQYQAVMRFIAERLGA